jgi:hypothetical protein
VANMIVIDSSPRSPSMSNTSSMSRQERLRRVLILCCSFARNLAYYWVGRSKEFLPLQSPVLEDIHDLRRMIGRQTVASRIIWHTSELIIWRTSCESGVKGLGEGIFRGKMKL